MGYSTEIFSVPKLFLLVIYQTTVQMNMRYLLIQRLTHSESIAYELLPLYLDRSHENHTITCSNTTGNEISCYGGYCKSISQKPVASWFSHDCGDPSESSVLSSKELISLTAFFFKFEPANPDENQVNDNKMTLLCNVNSYNSLQTRNKGKLILDEYNRAAFDFVQNNVIAKVHQYYYRHQHADMQSEQVCLTFHVKTYQQYYPSSIYKSTFSINHSMISEKTVASKRDSRSVTTDFIYRSI